MTKTTTSIATALLLGTALIAGTAQAQSSPASSAAAASATLSGADHKLSHADKAFLEDAAHNGHAEIEASKLALTKAESPDVKAYAQKLIDEHTKAAEELGTLAASKGVKVSDEPSITQKAKLKLLSVHDGAKFDKSFVDSIGIKAHQDTIKLFQKAATNAKDPDVKAFAVKTLPTLQHHLSQARDLYATVHQEAKK